MADVKVQLDNSMGILDTHSSFAIRRQSKIVHRMFGATHHWAINSPADLERANPKLRCTDVVSGYALQGDAPRLPARTYQSKGAGISTPCPRRAAPRPAWTMFHRRCR